MFWRFGNGREPTQSASGLAQSKTLPRYPQVYGRNATRQTHGGFPCAELPVCDRDVRESGDIAAVHRDALRNGGQRRKSIAGKGATVVMARHGIHSPDEQHDLADF